MSCLEPITFMVLPDEIMEKISNFLPFEDLLSLCLVGNKRLRDCSYNFLGKKPYSK